MTAIRTLPRPTADEASRDEDRVGLTAPLSQAARDAVAVDLVEIACAAGEILRGYHGGDCPHALKADGSPASLADARAEAFIVERLSARFPGVPVVAEETRCEAEPAELFFLVDPLDGTRDFLAGQREYSVNIALIEGDRTVAAALVAPGLFRAWGAGTTAFEAAVREGRPQTSRPVATRTALGDGMVALVSRRHGDAGTDTCLGSLPVNERRVASSALKFGLIAAGEADLYVRCAPTMEWDTAAGDHVLTVAGGCVVGPDGRPLTYGHRGRYYRNGPFAALGDCSRSAALSLPASCTVTYLDRKRAGTLADDADGARSQAL